MHSVVCNSCSILLELHQALDEHCSSVVAFISCQLDWSRFTLDLIWREQKSQLNWSEVHRMLLNRPYMVNSCLCALFVRFEQLSLCYTGVSSGDDVLQFMSDPSDATVKMVRCTLSSLLVGWHQPIIGVCDLRNTNVLCFECCITP